MSNCPIREFDGRQPLAHSCCEKLAAADIDRLNQVLAARAEAALSEAKLAEANRALLDVHDALHASCDGATPLPDEIRALRARLAEVERQRDEIEALPCGECESANEAERFAREKWTAAEADAKALRELLALCEANALTTGDACPLHGYGSPDERCHLSDERHAPDCEIVTLAGKATP